MAKKGKSSSNKKNLKITLAILFLFGLGAAVFLFFHKEKTTPTLPSAVGSLKVHKKPMVKKILPGSAGKIAFVLDDWGWNKSTCHYLKEIKAPLAISVLPNLRFSNDVMKCASINNKDIMLHLPLEAYHNFDTYPNDYVLTTAMPDDKIEKLLGDILKKMPLVVGVNNHMGSKATENRALMKVIFRKLKEKGLFFIDSMVAPHYSICAQLADEMKLPFGKRDIFLDNINTKEAIEKQIRELAQKARRKGYAIAIGHDRSLTLQVIEDEIPILEREGFKIVHLKDLLRNQ